MPSIHTYMEMNVPEVWNSLGFTIHDDDDRIKLQFVKYEERGSYD